MLELIKVSKTFAGQTALHPVDYEVSVGKTHLLIGPSGCGKSTILRLMNGLILPDTGEVRFQGQAMRGKELVSLRRRMGYVIQDGGLFPHLTSAENVALLARQVGWRKARITPRMQELAELTRLPLDVLDRYPAQISGGQRQRVSLMRALMLDPDVLLLDEPLGALDPMVRAELQTDLRDIFRAVGKTVVMVTHDIGEAAYFADIIVLLRAGKIVQQGTLAEFVNSPAEPFVTEFVNAQRSYLDVVAQAVNQRVEETR